MYKPSVDWNPKQARLREALKDQDRFAEAMEICKALHAMVHLQEVSGPRHNSQQADAPADERSRRIPADKDGCRTRADGLNDKTLADEVRESLKEEDYSVMPTPADETIAWCIWHTARIEDITMNLLVKDDRQALDSQWLEKLGVQVTDTGNAMSDEEIIRFSKSVNKEALWDYRCEVGHRSREILERLEPQDLKKSFTDRQLSRLLLEGCLLDHPDSIWLKDFWGRKNVSGILLMPLTRHQAGHLNDCLRIKKKCGLHK